MVGDNDGDCDDDFVGCVVFVRAHADDVTACWTSSSRPYCTDIGKKTL